MFGLPRKPAPPPPPARSIRDTLFDDAPLGQWPAAPSEHEPWKTFIRAAEAIESHDPDEAIAAWRSIIATPGLESRHYGQAWTYLRQMGIQPSPVEAKQLLGVVLEVPVEGGLDLLAAYPERTARYYNYSGRGVVWEHPDDSLDAPIDALLAAGQNVLNVIGPWTETRLAPPPVHEVRLNFLSPAGLHFGQALFTKFEKDPLAGPVIFAGVKLMTALIEKSNQR